jgi:putative transposase
VHFVTLTVVGRIDSLKYCQKNKGLELYAWCLMPSHLHMIISAKEDVNLSDILRDFKKFTSKEIIRLIQEEPESRREWMLDKFEFAGRYNPKIKNYKFWQDGNKPNRYRRLVVPCFSTFAGGKSG